MGKKIEPLDINRRIIEIEIQEIIQREIIISMMIKENLFILIIIKEISQNQIGINQEEMKGI